MDYLGHYVSAESLRPTQEKVRALTEAPSPNNASQLWSFLGLVNYYVSIISCLCVILGRRALDPLCPIGLYV